MTDFDAERDRNYGFFCTACLIGLPEDERSPDDGRYCRRCEQTMAEDRQERQRALRSPQVAPLEAQDEVRVVLRSETLENENDKAVPKRRIRRTADKVAAPVCGRPQKNLPGQLMLSLGAAGSVRETLPTRL